MKLPNQLKQTANLSDSYEDETKATFNRKEFTKGQFLFSQGEVCRQMFYIEKGLARIFYNSNSGKEITTWFSKENTFITSIDSFYQHKATQYNCELLEDSVVPVSMTNASQNMRFAAAISGFGMLMKQSEYKGTLSKQMVLDLANDALTFDPFDYRKSFVELVKNMD